MHLRRLGFVATLAAGTLMIASAVHGLTRVDTTLRLADAPVVVHRHDCDRSGV